MRVAVCGAGVSWNADQVFHAASTMKLAVLVELHRRAAEGTLRLDAVVPLTARFASLVGGEYELDPRDDADPALYARLGGLATLRELGERMIVRSSNLATNLLLERLGADAVTQTCRALGASRLHVLRGVEDGPAFRAGLVNTTTARDLAVLLEALARDAVPGARACVDVLLRQEHRDGIPRALPAEWRCANKTGVLRDHAHDAALVLPPSGAPLVVVVLTQGLDEARGFDLIRRVAECILPVGGT